MPRTASSWSMDTAHRGGWVFVGASELSVLSTTTVPVLTRAAEGDFNLTRTAGGAETIRFIAQFPGLRRILNPVPPLPFQEQFGGSIGPGPNVGIPPFTGQTQLTPSTWPPKKGLMINNIVVSWKETVADLTSMTATLDEIVYANGVANAITNVPLTLPSFPLVAAALPRLVTIPVVTPTMNVDDLSNFMCEVDIVMGNTGVLAFQGIGFHVNFNYN